MKKKIAISTCLWGNWHLKCFTEFNIPSLLNPNNFPYLCANSNCEYTIATNKTGREILEKNSNFIKLKKFIEIKFNIVSKLESIPTEKHVNWYNYFIEYSSKNNSLSLLIPPDVIWSNSSFKNMLTILAKEKVVGISMPYLRVISEIIFQYLDGKIINYDSYKLVDLAINSLHPISVSILKEVNYTRPSLEKLWITKEKDLVLRNCIRELLIFDPKKVKTSEIWYPKIFSKKHSIYQVSNSNEIFFISLAPFFKDMNLYLPNFEISELEIAKQTLHPLNDIDAIDFFSNIDIHLKTKSNTNDERICSDLFFEKVIQKRKLIKLYKKIRNLKINQHFLSFLGHLIISDNYSMIFDKNKFNLLINKNKINQNSITDIKKTDDFINTYFFNDLEISYKKNFNKQKFKISEVKPKPIFVNEFKIFNI